MRGGGDHAATPLGHPLSDGPLPDGMIMDVGLEHYNEFACSRSTFATMVSSGIPNVDGKQARLQVMQECVGGHNVIVKVWA